MINEIKNCENFAIKSITKIFIIQKRENTDH